MQILLPPPRIIEMLLKPQKPCNAPLRDIAYCVRREMPQGQLLYNTLTRELLLLAPGEEDAPEVRSALYARRFLVPRDHDDQKLADELREFCTLHQRKQLGGAITGYTILPTTDCNARCFYCYEHGIHKEHMRPETAMDVVRYIDAHRLGKPVHLNWFGGEPLFNADIIDLICAELARREVPFRSGMISNAFLFDEAMIRRAADWKLKSIQVTLDGTEPVYNRRKAYIQPGRNPFERVLTNIQGLLQAGIRVNIRLNLDRENEADLYALCDLLAERFSGQAQLFVYPSLISPAQIPLGEQDDRRNRLEALEHHIAAKLQLAGGVNDRAMQMFLCMADSPNAVVILPDGSLHSCEHINSGQVWGHINSDAIRQEARDFFRQRYPAEEACRSCPHYPSCIRLVCCPVCDARCTPLQRRKLDRILDRTLERHWNAYLKKEQEETHETEIPGC